MNQLEKTMNSSVKNGMVKINKKIKIKKMEKIKCYVCCYGGYLLAVGAGCTFGTSLLWGTVLLAGAAYWAYKHRCCAKNGTCIK